MSDEELRPRTEEELRHQPLSKEDIYFKKLEAERLAAKARHEGGEAKLLSPIDGTPMLLEDFHGMIIHRCATSRGVWLDEHEFDLLRRGLEEDPKENLLQRWMKNILPYQH